MARAQVYVIAVLVAVLYQAHGLSAPTSQAISVGSHGISVAHEEIAQSNTEASLPVEDNTPVIEESLAVDLPSPKPLKAQQEISALGQTELTPSMEVEQLKLSAGLGTSGISVDKVKTGTLSTNKVSRAESAESAAEKSNWGWMIIILLAGLVYFLLSTEKGRHVAEKMGMMQPKDSWAEMDVSSGKAPKGDDSLFLRLLDAPLVQEALSMLGVRARSEEPQKPENVKLLVNAVQFIKPPEPVDADFAPKGVRGDLDMPQEPLMSESANRTFEALADMLDSAGCAPEIAERLRGSTGANKEIPLAERLEDCSDDDGDEVQSYSLLPPQVPTEDAQAAALEVSMEQLEFNPNAEEEDSEC